MEHYYSKEPKSEFSLKKIRQSIKGIEFHFYTSSGIFSKSRIDKGSLLLAENMVMEKNANVLDMGCGLGILGIVAAKLFGANATMTDINKRAVLLAGKNTELNGVGAKILQGNLYDSVDERDFDVVLSNPPQNAGKDVCFEIIEKSKYFLRQKGTLQIVARPSKGGKALGEKMGQVFGNVTVIAKKSGYSVYMSVKD